MTHKLYPRTGSLYVLNEIERALLITAMRRFADDTQDGGFAALIESVLARLQAPSVQVYPPEDKIGAYQCIGAATGEGTSRHNVIAIYRDNETGNLYFRTPDDFAARMEKANTP